MLSGRAGPAAGQLSAALRDGDAVCRRSRQPHRLRRQDFFRAPQLPRAGKAGRNGGSAGRRPRVYPQSRPFSAKPGPTHPLCTVRRLGCPRPTRWLSGVPRARWAPGRSSKDAPIDHAAGILLERVRGEYVRSGGALATLFADSIERLDEAEALLADAFRLQDKKPQPTKTIYKTIC